VLVSLCCPFALSSGLLLLHDLLVAETAELLRRRRHDFVRWGSILLRSKPTLALRDA